MALSGPNGNPSDWLSRNSPAVSCRASSCSYRNRSAALRRDRPPRGQKIPDRARRPRKPPRQRARATWPRHPARPDETLLGLGSNRCCRDPLAPTRRLSPVVEPRLRRPTRAPGPWHEIPRPCRGRFARSQARPASTATTVAEPSPDRSGGTRLARSRPSPRARQNRSESSEPEQVDSPGPAAHPGPRALSARVENDR